MWVACVLGKDSLAHATFFCVHSLSLCGKCAASFFLSTDVEHLSWNLKRTLFDAYIRLDTLGKVSLHRAFVSPRPTSYNCHFKRAWPYCRSNSILIYICVSFLFCLHLFSPPLFQLSSHLLLSSSTFFLLLPFITVHCDTYLVAASHPLFHWEEGIVTKRSAAGAAFLCMCSFAHVWSSTMAVTIIPNFCHQYWADSTGIVKLQLCACWWKYYRTTMPSILMSPFCSCTCIVLRQKIHFPVRVRITEIINPKATLELLH